MGSGAGVLTHRNLLQVPLLANNKFDRSASLSKTQAEAVSGAPVDWLPLTPATHSLPHAAGAQMGDAWLASP